MTNTLIPPTRPRKIALGLLLLAVAPAGCSDGERGTVSGPPTEAVGVVAQGSAKGRAPVPHVPRGPAQAKALQVDKTK
jgi:hypothetical protein